MTPRTCAICGQRDATRTTPWDGRLVPCCDDCEEPTPAPQGGRKRKRPLRSPRSALVALVARLGPVTPRQIAAHLGIDTPRRRDSQGERQPYTALSVALHRAHRAGELAGEWVDPRVPNRGRVYSVARAA